MTINKKVAYYVKEGLIAPEDMDEMIEHEKKLKAGLTYTGINEEGEREYMGTSQQWDKSDK